MIKVENIDVWGFEHAIRGMRNPLNSWDKSDSDVAFHVVENFAPDDPMQDKYWEWRDKYNLNIKIGKNDLDLMRRLYKAGTEHRKYLRQIFVSMDITAPLYWWKEFDTYKVGIVANSCSTMHKIASKEFELDDFSHEHLVENVEIGNPLTVIFADRYGGPTSILGLTIDILNVCRSKYLETNDKKFWWQMIQLLPSSYNQRRTVTMNYENVMSMINQRTGHKLDEWNTFVDILKSLPYIKEIRGDNE